MKENELMKHIYECKKDCPVHKLFTHNTCLKCMGFKNSPYYEAIFGKTNNESEK